MPLLEDHTASFIVRIWRELGEGSTLRQEWRGSIEHVQSGRRSFFRDLSAIAKFMQPELQHLGIDTPLRFWDLMSPELAEPLPPAPAASEMPPLVAPRNRRPPGRKR